MFNLVDTLKSKQKQEAEQEQIQTVLFYQTESCQNLVQESYRFEGIAEPATLLNNDDEIAEHVRLQSVEIVIIELNDSKNIAKDAERISHLLPSHASVIVIGSEDAISTIRNLKALGFYYLFWPITKQELIDFVRSVHENRERNRGPGQNRRAKRVSILGAKGGVGATAITAELSYLLSEEKHASCVVVDHNYTSGNIDIMLGIQKFEKRRMQRGAFTELLDLSSARGLLYKQSELLSVLGLTSKEFSHEEIAEYHRSVINVMMSECNFIIEDFSASSGQVHLEKNSWLDSDCIILVLSPTVSSLRDAGRLKLLLDKVPLSERPRVLVVVNHTCPEKFSTVTFSEIEKFLEIKPDAIVPFISNFGEEILNGKRLAKLNNKSSVPIRALASLVVGEKTIAKSSWLNKWFKKA
ncbi:AAA family ATPase [Vibrio tritonius]|uniref:AAA family ATPase n=1 Tax=Vibrio tritonius TaxID=1435069 RepID=UPI000837B58B|nr:hypothetical protein [Vibrio tritonius]